MNQQIRPQSEHAYRTQRSGSVTLLAFVALIVLSIMVFTLHSFIVNTHSQLHHAYYNEKAMALIEGFVSIARGEAQKSIQTIIEANGDWCEIPGVPEKALALRLLKEDTVQPTVTVQARILKSQSLKYFNEGSPYKTFKDDKPLTNDESGIFSKGNEVEGIVEIKVSLKIGGFGSRNFSVPQKTVITQYEFKRIKAVPPFIRHFSLYVKNAISEDEEPDDFTEQGNFNYAYTPLTGGSAGGAGVLFVNSGTSMSSMQLPTVNESSSGSSSGNPFEDNIGYIYLGGDKDASAYLNLTAGDDNQPYSETFQLYRGTTTDFYKVWDSDFSNFIERARTREQPGASEESAAATEESWVSSAVNWLKEKARAFMNWLKKAVKVLAQLDALEYSGASDMSSNLPLYYIVRKDYGYALEWGKKAAFRRFGFGGGEDGNSEGQKIFSNALHLYGTKNFDGNENMCPTLVMGNVYRRYLSLAGYKQRRSSENPSSKRKFEVQAGPIEYFKTYKSLMKREADPTKDDPAVAPIWVWDARVDWNRNTPNMDGTYLPLSGAALFGRIIPGMARLWEDDQSMAAKLFNYSICPPDELSGGADPEESASTIVENGGDHNEDVKGGISPLFLKLGSGYFNKSAEYSKGRIYEDTTPYFEELLRCFAYSSYGTMKQINDGNGSDDLNDPEIKQIVELAAARWQEAAGLAGASGSPMEVRKIRIPDDIKGDESQKKAKFWNRTNSTGGTDPAENIYPFSLPDPWVNDPKVVPNFQEKFENACSNDREEFFKRYFYHLMTNPAMVQPYNNGMRFIFKPLRDIFAKSGDDRIKELSENIIPEIRDGISFIVDGKNEYLKRGPKDRFNKPINDDVLKAIHKKRKGDAYLKQGYFFMDDYGKGIEAPSDIDISDAFTGRRHFWKMGWDDFKRRFVQVNPMGQTIRLNTIIALTEPLVIDTPTQIVGSGAILIGSGEKNSPISIDGEATIKANITGGGNVFIVAKKISLEGEVEFINSSLIAIDEIKFGGNEYVKIDGNVICNKWDFRRAVVQGGSKFLINFNSKLKKDETYLQNIEPRIHKFLITGGKD